MSIDTIGALIAGTEYVLTCTAEAPGSTAQLQWVNPAGVVLNGSDDLAVGLQHDGSLQLTFSSLAGEHEGLYTCNAVLTWPVNGIVVQKSSSLQIEG